MKQILAAEIIKRLPQFKKWLVERGGELLEPSNEYELVRFRTGKGTSVIYRKKDANLAASFIGEALTAWTHYVNPGSKWRAIPATKRPSHGVNYSEYVTIRKRDGDDCFFCGRVVSVSDATIEHLVSLTHGGPQHLSNKFLAHSRCNGIVGNISAVEKIAIHVQSAIKKMQEETSCKRTDDPKTKLSKQLSTFLLPD